jgi:hypothetical protein
MGVERIVHFAKSGAPRWCDVADVLARRGIVVQVRMIDGELALPDDLVPDNWTELRVGTAPGMVTLKRQGDRISLVTWSNADQALLDARDQLAAALKDAGQSTTQGNPPAYGFACDK